MRYKDGAVKALDAGECFVCKSKKEIELVVTLHAERDLHIPCCSYECAEKFAEMIAETA